MPDHPGSDFAQQRAMLAGDRPPPGPEELRQRPRDVSALLDAVASGELLSDRSLETRSVAVIGHSWGATTSLQLAGGAPVERVVVPLRRSLRHRAEHRLGAARSWLSGIRQAAITDPRVKLWWRSVHRCGFCSIPAVRPVSAPRCCSSAEPETGWFLRS